MSVLAGWAGGEKMLAAIARRLMTPRRRPETSLISGQFSFRPLVRDMDFRERPGRFVGDFHHLPAPCSRLPVAIPSGLRPSCPDRPRAPGLRRRRSEGPSVLGGAPRPRGRWGEAGLLLGWPLRTWGEGETCHSRCAPVAAGPTLTGRTPADPGVAPVCHIYRYASQSIIKMGAWL